MEKKISPKIASLVFGILVICFVVVSFVFASWSTQTTAPGNDAPAPLNVSSTAQGKLGSLGIGTTSPQTTLDVEGTVRLETEKAPSGANQCLLSADIYGTAVWGSCPSTIGATGPQGLQGLQGPQGPTGPAAPGLPCMYGGEVYTSGAKCDIACSIDSVCNYSAYNETFWAQCNSNGTWTVYSDNVCISSCLAICGS